MNKYSVDNIRKSFIEFFESKNHLAAHSFPLIPKNDNTLLLVNAGMAPLKRFFTGADTPPRTRMVTCQKCVRTGDIENVGYTSRHCTFFEMLGNFSFGDYFKREAINWAWEFMTSEMKIDHTKLWVSVYLEDDEAYKIWKDEIKVPEDRIVRLGKEDNFWELEVGPSGPCSEIYFDRGPEYDCGDPDCMPGCDCDRYVEVWNLVFTQFDKDEKGIYHPLANPNIDTGMGLERMAAVLQGKENVFEIEPLVSIINLVEKISGIEYGKDKKIDISVRIITDHARAVTFLIGDGVIPSNEGRGYVLRRLLRRAARHGKLLGIRDNFIASISKMVIDMFGEAYPELSNSADQIYKIIEIEEDRFSKTIDQGIEILNSYTEKMAEMGTTELSGEQAFKLYDTYGFPFELTEEILGEKGLTVREESFVEFMNKQKENARKARNSSAGEAWLGSSFKIENADSTVFRGYTEKEAEAIILKLYDEKYNEVKSIEDKGFAVTDATVLYAESGGQKGDCGLMAGEGVSAHVEDVTKANNDIFLHHVKVNSGSLKTGDKVKVAFNVQGRNAIAANHTATHLLHEALRQVLGSHVNQAGSLVEKERLRFDFSHFEGMTHKEIEGVEKLVNEKIFENLAVSTASMTLDEAKASGITALFDSKYGEKVRVISVEDYSRELCGGTHVNNTSEIGLFKIVSEAGIASGIRRIEALTGMDAFDYLNAYRDKTFEMASMLKTKPENIENRINQIIAESKEKDAVINNYKSEAVRAELGNILDNYIEEGNIKIFLNNLGESDADQMRELSDRIKDKYSDSVTVLAAESNGKVLLIASVAKPLVKEGLHAGNIIREAAKIVGGGGGGRPDFAQAGGKNPEKIDEALNKALEIIKGMIK